MNGDLIIIVLVIATAMLAVLVAKLISFCRKFAAHTRYICYEMDHAADYEEYRRRRGELRCHYLCLIPFVNGKNVMRLHNRIYHKADKVTKERKDSLVPLLLPSIFGIFICTVCVCSMTWAWYTASLETPAQKLTAAYYEVTVESVMSADGEVEPLDGSYSLEEGKTYTVKLKASGSVRECGGYCLIENAESGEKIFTQIFKPEESISVQIMPSATGLYTFTGVWGSHPTSTTDEDIIKAADGVDNGDPGNVPAIDDSVPDNAGASTQVDPINQPSYPFDGTYTVQPGDTLSGIAESFNTTADKIAAYNGITDKGDIKAGQVLNIPPEDYVIPIPETTAPQEPETSTEPVPELTDMPSESTPESELDLQTEPVSEDVTELTSGESDDSDVNTEN